MLLDNSYYPLEGSVLVFLKKVTFSQILHFHKNLLQLTLSKEH